MSRWLLLALALGAASALFFGDRRSADAHAYLVRADPPANAQLREPPTELTLYFSEPLERRLSGARVVDQNGARVDDRVEFNTQDDAALRVFLKPLSPGYVNVIWETVSQIDGHRVTGSYPLTILNPDGSVPAGAPVSAGAQVSGTSPQPGRVIDRFLLLLAGCLLVGALTFVAYVTPALPGEAGARARVASDRWALRLIAAALGVLVAGGLIELLLQAWHLDTGVSDVLNTRWGERWLLRNLLLLAPLVSLAGLARSKGGARPFVAGLGLAGGAAYLAVTSSVSHSAAGAGAFWAASSDFVHLLAASVWIGMLALLVLTFLWARKGLERGERYPVLATALQRFSALAVVSVALLLVTGTLNAVIEVDRLSDLLETGYGRALLVKLLLLAPLLAVGAYNAYLLRPRLVEEAAAQGSRDRLSVLGELEVRLAKTVRWELGVAVAVIAVVALLVQSTPTRGRLSTPEQTGRYTETVGLLEVQATLVIDPNQPGINSFEVFLTGAVDTVERVRLDFTLPGSDLGESRLILDTTNLPTYYVGKGPLLTKPGKWKVVVDLRRTSGSDLRLPFSVQLADPGGAVSAARGGGAFAAPVSFSATQVALIALVAAVCVALVAGSVRPASVIGGYVSLVAEAASERLSTTRLRPVWSLAALLVIGVGLGLIVGAHVHPRLSPEEAAKENPVASSPDSIARGEMLFFQNCSQCHGESGRGDGPLAATLTLKPANLYDHIPYHPDDFFFGVMTNGLGGVMPSFKSSISNDDRWNILNYLRDRFGQLPATE